MNSKTLVLSSALLAAACFPACAQPSAEGIRTESAAGPQDASNSSLKGFFAKGVNAVMKVLRRPASGASAMKVVYPFDQTIFPKDIRSPEFRWEGPVPPGGAWTIRVSFKNSGYTVGDASEKPRWTPSAAVWDDIRTRSLENPAVFEVAAAQDGKPGSAASVTFTTSRDPVGAPIFFRAVPAGPEFPLEKDYVKVKWKLGWVSSYAPPIVVMRNQTTCFNCHAASADGKTFGFDYNSSEEDMSSYLLFRERGKTVNFLPGHVMDWNDYKRGNNVHPYQANASAISPDGKVVVTAGRALSMVAPKAKDIIQYALPMRGIILYRTFDDPTIRALPGGDDESFVHYASSWSPDGKYIYYFGSPITPQLDQLGRDKLAGVKKDDKRRLGWRDFDKLYPIRYDVYRIPFAGGKGGRAEKIAGASANGRSNYFPRASPDGKWLVYAQSANGATLVREDSDLYIVPAAGGTARKLRSNGPRADSWHSWSPNGRWLAFASKSYGQQTDIVLTHIDAAGADSPPIVLTQMRDEGGLAANLPEFFNIKPGQLEEIIPRLR